LTANAERRAWSDEAIEAALAEAHVPSLVNALVHLTDDESLIRGEERPTSQLFGDPRAVCLQNIRRMSGDSPSTPSGNTGTLASRTSPPRVQSSSRKWWTSSPASNSTTPTATSRCPTQDLRRGSVPPVLDDLPADARRDFHILV